MEQEQGNPSATNSGGQEKIDYIPYGDEWVKEISKMPKKAIIEILLRPALMKQSEIASIQEKISIEGLILKYTQLSKFSMDLASNDVDFHTANHFRSLSKKYDEMATDLQSLDTGMRGEWIDVKPEVGKFSANDIDGAYLLGIFNVSGIDGLSKEIERIKEIGIMPHITISMLKNAENGGH